MLIPLKTWSLPLVAAVSLVACGCRHTVPQADSSNRSASRALTPLSTGRAIDPSHATSSADVGTMTLAMVISPDQQYAVTTSSGFRQELCVVRLKDGQPVSRIDFPKISNKMPGGLYYGLIFGPDGTLYAAQGANSTIARFTLSSDGLLTRQGDIALTKSDFPAGLATDARGHLYITHNDPASDPAAFGVPASMSIIDTATTREVGRVVFPDPIGLSNFPLAVTCTSDGRVFVASERDDKVYVIDASDSVHPSIQSSLTTGSHPLALQLTRDQKTLYVANAHSDTVSVVNVEKNRVEHTILLRPQIAQDLAGATPTGLALSDDEEMLYVTLGDMNAVAVVDLAEAEGPRVEGYIPAGWYPTCVRVHDDQLIITNAKGDVARVPHDFSQGTAVRSPLYLYAGSLWRLPIPDSDALAKLTRESLANARLTPRYLGGENPLTSISKNAGKIKHVIYVVKENRTYDQVLGDLPQGNGDASRCLFGREITPNLHALAERFVLLDNFYDSGEVSGDGWTWSTQAQANEYTIRNVPYHYADRGRNFDFEGSNNDYPTGGFPAKGLDGKPTSEDPRFAQGGIPVPDVAASPGGHLWDMAQKQKLTYRNYGFFLSSGVKEKGKVITPDNYPSVPGLQPAGRDLAGVTNIDYRKFDLEFPDSDAPSHYATRESDPTYLWGRKFYGNAKLTSRIAEWKREFQMMLEKDPTGESVPNLMTVRLGTDHTVGANPGKPTPRCMLADNDYAVGQLVETVSHSAIWNSCAIVVIEDDAQNGPDHVDAHRSTCYVISPWIRRGLIDHSFQNTVSAIRTIESLLNLPPMCQYDAASAVIGGWDTSPANAEPFTAILPAREIMKQRNPLTNKRVSPSPEQPLKLPATQPSDGASLEMPLNSADDLALISLQMNFTQADQAPADLLNRVIWKTVKGAGSEMPYTPRIIGADGRPAHDSDD